MSALLTVYGSLAAPAWQDRSVASTVLVTGASGGIGAAVVRTAVDRGDRVLAVGRDAARLDELCAGLPTAVPVFLDLRDPTDLPRQLVELDHLDALVHCAGVAEVAAVEETPYALWQDTLMVNVAAAAELTRALLPALRNAAGRVVFINAAPGLHAVPRWSAYAASKAALRELADSLRAEEARHGLRVTTIYPGGTATELLRKVRAQFGRPFDAAECIRPETLASLVLTALDAPDDAYVTELSVLPAPGTRRPGIYTPPTAAPAGTHEVGHGVRSTATTTDDLLRQQDELQAEAGVVSVDLQLDQWLSAVGEPVRVGSAALGLLVRRDLDLTVVCPALDPATTEAVAQLGARLAVHPRVRQVQLRDDTGHWNTDPTYPDGLYLGVRYRSPQGCDWNLDIWFVDQPERQPDLAHVQTMPARLTPDIRTAILQIKAAWADRPEYGTSVTSYDVYRSVLDDGVRTPQQFHQWSTRTRSS
jgi:NADP-dependent 3-hydroxy acid dehydrogenase YdfG